MEQFVLTVLFLLQRQALRPIGMIFGDLGEDFQILMNCLDARAMRVARWPHARVRLTRCVRRARAMLVRCCFDARAVRYQRLLDMFCSLCAALRMIVRCADDASMPALCSRDA